MLSTKSYSYSYPNGIEALKNINFTISNKEFVLLTGSNGGGKSTLLRSVLGVIPAYYGGKQSGSIIFNGKPVNEYGIVKLAGNIGIVLQDPESQISNMNVWEEVTFALRNLLFPKEEISIKANNALHVMGLTELAERSVHELSGGQLQRLSIAALIALQPKILVFDEPLANLDPLGIISVIDALNKVREYVDIVIVASHWLDPFLDLATRVIVIDSGEIALDVDKKSLDLHLDTLHEHNVEIPQIHKMMSVLKQQGVSAKFENNMMRLPAYLTLKPLLKTDLPKGRMAIQLANVFYAYSKGENVLKDIKTQIAWGSRVAIMGHNGTGKTTLAKLLVGLRKPTMGSINNMATKKTMMFQKPSLGFITTTVQSELMYGTNISERKANSLLSKFDLLRYRENSPFELSGGEQRRLALALTIAENHDLLILDEPTAGLDAQQVRFFQSILEEYQGTSIYISHDPRIIGGFIKEIVVLHDGNIQFHGSTTEMNKHLLEHLGIPTINPVVALALRYLDQQIPMRPEQLEVINATCL